MKILFPLFLLHPMTRRIFSWGSQNKIQITLRAVVWIRWLSPFGKLNERAVGAPVQTIPGLLISPKERWTQRQFIPATITKERKQESNAKKSKELFLFLFFSIFFFYSPLIITSDESAAVRVGVVTRVLASLFSSSIFSNVLTVMDFIVRCCCWPFLFLEFHFVSMSQLQRSKENHILFVKDVHPKR